MADGDRRTSDDLIRDANRRLRGASSEPESVEESLPAGSDSTPPGGPEPIQYRSQQEPVRPETTHDRPDETEGNVSTQTEQGGPIETRPRRRIRIGGILARLILAALVFGGWTFFTSLNDANRDDSGAIVAQGDLDVMSLQIGDCFNDPEELDEVVFDVAAVPCAEPHDNEVFSVQSIGTAFGDAYPGDAALEQHSYEVCSGAPFDAYVGTAYLDSSLDVFTFTPTAESWDEGDREYVCALYRLDFGQLTGTARDSGL
jgi:hypothetical protein